MPIKFLAPQKPECVLEEMAKEPSIALSALLSGGPAADVDIKIARAEIAGKEPGVAWAVA